MRCRLIVFVVLLPAVFKLQAEVYRCVGVDGKQQYSDRPCPENSSQEKVEIRSENADADAERTLLPDDAGLQLQDAARRGDTAKIEQLIDWGVDVNERDELGFTALHQAGHRLGKLELVQTLIAAGADVNALSVMNYSVLAKSIYRLDIASYLIEQGARINIRDKNGGNSILHVVVKDPIAADGMIDLLLNNGADIDIRDDEGNTPLHAATWRADDPLSTVSILLDRGAWVDAKNANGETPLDVARERARQNVREAVIELIQSRGTD